MKMVYFTLFFLILTSCNSSNKNPSEEEWSYAINVLKDFVGNEGIFYHSRDSGVSNIDFFKTNENYFAAIISAKNDSMKLYASYVGYLEHVFIYHAKIHEFKIMTDEEYNNYTELVLNDSLWILIDSNTIWNKTGYYKSLWEESIYIDPMNDGSNFMIYGSTNLKLHKKLKKK